MTAKSALVRSQGLHSRARAPIFLSLATPLASSNESFILGIIYRHP